MKSIHERVRATLAKQERDAQRKVDRAHDARLRRLERADAKLEAEIDARYENGELGDTLDLL